MSSTLIKSVNNTDFGQALWNNEAGMHENLESHWKLHYIKIHIV